MTETSWAHDVDALLNQIDEDLDVYATKVSATAANYLTKDEQIKRDVAYIIEGLDGEEAWRVGNMLYEALSGRTALARMWVK